MKPLFLLLFLALAAYGQQALTSVAVLPSDANGAALNSDELEALTDEMRETALKVLPTNIFVLLKQDVVIKRLGGAENFIKECKESTCIVNLGKKAQVDYVSQATVSKLGNKIRLKVELYNVRTEGFVGMFTDEAENIRDLLEIVKKRAPAEIFSKIPGASGSSKTVSPSVAGGISGLQKTAAYEADGEKLYLVNLSTEPSGAALSFDGVPSCPKTPCKVELRGGSVRIIAALEQYETTDTTVSIKQSNQNIAITLKPNFGILEIKPAYSDGIGKDKQWNLSINDKSYSLGEVRLSTNKYAVKLNHECYENIGFEVGINKGKREVFDMASNITLKKGGLTLSAEKNGEPVSEPVFVNGKQVGETPFNGAVPLCARVEVGSGREMVDVKLKHNDKVKHIHRFYKPVRRSVYAEDNNTPQYESPKSLSEALQNLYWFGMGFDSEMYSYDGFHMFTNVEFFKPSASFFSWGLNLDLGILSNGDILSNDQAPFIKGGVFLKLHPLNFIKEIYPPASVYLLGGANFGYYSNVDGCFVFPVGFGISAPIPLVIFLEGQYNIAVLKNGIGGYGAFNFGFNFKTTR